MDRTRTDLIAAPRRAGPALAGAASARPSPCESAPPARSQVVSQAFAFDAARMAFGARPGLSRITPAARVHPPGDAARTTLA